MGEEESSFTRAFRDEEYTKTYVQKHWPKMVSALEEYGISCELNLVECSMTISTAGKTIDANIFQKAKDIVCLLARTFPARQAVKILNGKMEYEEILIGHQEAGICSKYGIDKEQYHERLGWLANKSTKDALNKLTGAYLVVYSLSVPVIGSSDGLKEVRRIVEDCIQNGVHPESHIHRLRRKRKLDKKIVKSEKHNKTNISSPMEEHMKTQTQSMCYAHKCSLKKQVETYRYVLEVKQDTDVLEKIANKFSFSDSPPVHVDMKLTLSLIVQIVPPGFLTKPSSTSFIGRLFRHAAEDSQPKHVLVKLLSFFISFLDCVHAPITYEHRLEDSPGLTSNIPKASSDHTNQSRPRKQQCTAKSNIVAAMLEILGDLLQLLDVSSVDKVLLTTYGKLQPPLGSHRLKIVQFIARLLTVGGEAVEMELIRLGAVQIVLDLFFKYPYNNLVHGHIEHIIVSCLESKNAPLVRHLLHECDLFGKILHSENNFTLEADSNKPTVPNEGRCPPRIGNIGHLTRISNKIIQLGNNNSEIQAYLQEHREWTDWHTTALSKRNEVENFSLWACGRPKILKDKTSPKDIVITEDEYEHVMVSLNMIEDKSASEKTSTKDIVITETQPDSGHSLQ